ncbi:MAG: DNA repair protein RecO (recombination protein O) [Gammaproteobacteria bacterium]
MGPNLHPSYVLHRRPYRETSLILELWSAEYGRVGVIARGGARGRKRGGGILQAFQQYQVSWSGRSELRTLVKCESVGPTLQLAGERLFSGFYVNELTMRMTTRQDPNPELYSIYERTLSALATTVEGIEPILRRFEKSLLDACGYGLQLHCEGENGTAIDPDKTYQYAIEQGPTLNGDGEYGVRVAGKTLLALSRMGEFQSTELHEAKKLMRYVLQHYIGDRPLASRTLFRKTPTKHQLPVESREPVVISNSDTI